MVDGPGSESDSASSSPPPPQRGWYRIPDNPNYEHFWDGQNWTSQRYWGGAGTPTSASPSVAPPAAGPQLQQPAEPTWRGGPPARHPDNPSGYAPARVYSVTAMIVPPVFVVFLTLVAAASISHQASRVLGIGAAVLAVLMAVFWVRRPYVAIVRPDGSLTFKALLVSKETTISRVSRIGLSTGGRGGSSWIFHFDGTRASLGDIGGKALMRYVVNCNPDIEHPHRLFG